MFRYFLFASLIVLSSLAQAVPITWSLNDVRFADGAIATGSFIYDAETNSYSDVSIFTGIGDDYFLDVIEYGANAGSLSHHSMLFKSETGSCTALLGLCNRELTLYFMGPLGLTDSGGTHALELGSSMESSSALFEDGASSRFVISGSVSAMPAPSPAPFWLFMLALLAMVRFKKRAP